jgi:hypothetical protein
MGRSVRRPSCFKQPSRWRLPVAPLIEQRRGDVSPTGSKPVREGRRELPAKLKTRGLQQRYFQESGSGRPGSFRGPTYRPCAVRCPGICFFIGQNCREFFKACLVLRAEDQRQVLALSTPSPEVRFLAFPPVHRADLEGPLRVEGSQLPTNSDCLIRAGSGPTGLASGRTGVLAIGGIPLRARNRVHRPFGLLASEGHCSGMPAFRNASISRSNAAFRAGAEGAPLVMMSAMVRNWVHGRAM